MDTIDFNWKLLIRKIKRKKVVLFLGPELFAIDRSGRYSQKGLLQNYIKADLDGILEKDELAKIEYYSEDGFFYLEDSYRSEVVDSVIQFYSSLETNPFYRKIAEIPFHMILSLSPDKVLCKAFDELGLPYSFSYYSKKSYDRDAEDQNLDLKDNFEKRFIYNLFGCLNEEGSMILSYDDLFEFLQRILNNYSLPYTVLEALDEANYFIFLGFDYNKWYLKLLFRIIKMHEKAKKNFGMDLPLKKEFATFFINEFGMNFTRLGTVEFINRFYEICEAENLLVTRTSDLSLNKIKETYRKAVELTRKGQLQEAIAYSIEELQEHSNLLRGLIQLSNRMQKLEDDNLKGILTRDSYYAFRNRISLDLLNFLS